MDGEKIHYVLGRGAFRCSCSIESRSRPYNQDCRVLVYFSDNITTLELSDEVARFAAAESNPGCVLLAREEQNPQAFGVAVVDESGEVTDIVEKPQNPPSNLAIGGIYLFDENFWDYLDSAVLEHGQKVSFLDVTRQYVQIGKARLLSVGEEKVDCGTPDSLLMAGQMAKDGKLNPHPHR